MALDGLENLRCYMLSLGLLDGAQPLHILCIGAHSDDIEIGCAATLLRLAHSARPLRVSWVVLSALGDRAQEARRSAEELLGKTADLQVHVAGFRDAYFPADFGAIKDHFAELRRQTNPDLVFTHSIDDRHQDHRLVGELTWQAWRDHLILEYEIAKYEGDLGRPNVFVAASTAIAEAKIDHLLTHFGSQRSKDWFSRETFSALMRLRGIECRAADGFAEAFVARKLML
jgi:LmbE family N-acetylglucosaminyl deacetylase